MTAFWMTWKPEGWPVERLRDLINRFQADPATTEPWRVQAHRQAKPGSRVYLFKQGRDPRGIFGVGEIAEEPRLIPDQSVNPASPQQFVPIRFLRLVDPTEEMLLPLDDLQDIVMPSSINANASGTTLTDDLAEELDKRLGIPTADTGSAPGTRGSDWTQAEVDACVEAYLEMLDLEVAGTPYSKIAFNRRVQAATGRSKGSIEFKFGNVSAVMDRLGFRWVQGYKPAPNAQTGAISDAVMRLLGTRTQLAARLEVPPPSGSPATAPATGSEVFADAPPRSAPAGAKAQLPHGSNVRKFDRALTDAKNRDLGRAGEEFVLKAEKARLLAAGCKDLADKVSWTADEQGDGAGYDIASFNVDGTQRLIEVKTTNGSASTSFLVTANEVEVSRAHPDTYWLYRVYNFGKEPRIYCEKGPLDDGWHLEPAVFRARR
jgi:hypothetical protein